MKTVLCFSGGMDSSTLLYKLLADGDEVVCLGVDYGQRHKKELDSARKVAQAANVRFEVADLREITRFLAGSSQTDTSVEVPEGHYAEESMKKTVVPNRNMLMLALATSWAISLKYDRVAYAAHNGDHAIYPDCRAEFISALTGAVELADWHKITLYGPFAALTKGDIAGLGITLGVPFELTWSCYKGQELPCGKCGTCVERLEAFRDAGHPDPLEYQK